MDQSAYLGISKNSKVCILLLFSPGWQELACSLEMSFGGKLTWDDETKTATFVFRSNHYFNEVGAPLAGARPV